YNWFSAKNWIWGPSNFIKLDLFNQAGRGFSVKDSCIVEAEVTIHGTSETLQVCLILSYV
ncbi:unnamed protein product, partial [Prunus brigantina]